MTSVLITGGTGFIGSRLTLRCLASGEDVRVFGQRRNAAEDGNAQALVDAGAKVMEGSVTDPEATVRACEGVDVVYHLAAAQHEANVPDQHFYDVNVEGTRNLLEAAVGQGVSRFVHGSTIGVFGDLGSVPVSETAPLDPDNIYGVTKLAAEGVAQGYRDRLILSVLRISETYGPGDRRLLKLFRAIAKGRFVRIGRGRNLHHPVFVDDLIDGLRLAAQSNRSLSEPVVLTGPEAVSTDEMVNAIARALERSPPRLRIPLWPLLGVAAVLEGVLRPLGIQPPLHRRRMNFFVKSFDFDLGPAEAALGFRPSVDFDEGAVRTAAWYASEGLLPDPTT